MVLSKDSEVGAMEVVKIVQRSDNIISFCSSEEMHIRSHSLLIP